VRARWKTSRGQCWWVVVVESWRDQPVGGGHRLCVGRVGQTGASEPKEQLFMYPQYIIASTMYEFM
jgi:hypothetical protein